MSHVRTDYGDEMEYLENLVGMFLTNIKDGVGPIALELIKEKEETNVTIEARVTELEEIITQIKEENILVDRGFNKYRKCEPIIDVWVTEEEASLKFLQDKIPTNKDEHAQLVVNTKN